MKICTKCKVNKPFSAYDKNKQGRFGLSSWCKECVRPIRRKAVYAYRKRVMDKHMAPCYLCGNSDFRAIQFHHIFNKSQTAPCGRNSYREANKTVCLCGSCHNILHYESRKRHCSM